MPPVRDPQRQNQQPLPTISAPGNGGGGGPQANPNSNTGGVNPWPGSNTGGNGPIPYRPLNRPPAGGVGGQGGVGTPLTPGQVAALQIQRANINNAAAWGREDIGTARGLAALNARITRNSVLRSFDQGSEDLLRGFNLSREDQTRSASLSLEDLNRNASQSLEDLLRNFGRQREDAEQGFGRAEEDLGINRSRTMTSLIDSLGARGLTNSGLKNRAVRDTAGDFDRQGSRLAEDRNRTFGRLDEDNSFAQNRINDNLAFGTNRINSNLDFALNRLQSNFDFGSNRLNSDRGFAQGQWSLEDMMRENSFDMQLNQVNRQQTAARENLALERLGMVGDAASIITPGAGASGGNRPNRPGANSRPNRPGANNRPNRPNRPGPGRRGRTPRRR